MKINEDNTYVTIMFNKQLRQLRNIYFSVMKLKYNGFISKIINKT